MPPPIRLADLLEWIVAAAVALAVTRWTTLGFESLPRQIWLRMPRLVNPAFTGIVIVEGAALAWETARRRGPSSWGVGRWAWGATGIYLVLGVALYLNQRVALHLLVRKIAIDFQSLSEELAIALRMVVGLNSALWLFAGAVALRRVTGPLGRSHDAREWSGRVFIGLGLALATANQIFRMFNL